MRRKGFWPLALALLGCSGMACAINWQVYEQGSALELSMDHDSLWSEPDGLVHFVNQERFTRPQYDTHYKVHFSIRRTTGYADCPHDQFVLVSTDFYSADNKHVWSTMYPTPRYAWQWQTVNADSVADAMITLVCANPAPGKKPK
jgi:hypothetical protein